MNEDWQDSWITVTLKPGSDIRVTGGHITCGAGASEPLGVMENKVAEHTDIDADNIPPFAKHSEYSEEKSAAWRRQFINANPAVEIDGGAARFLYDQVPADLLSELEVPIRALVRISDTTLIKYQTLSKVVDKFMEEHLASIR